MWICKDEHDAIGTFGEECLYWQEFCATGCVAGRLGGLSHWVERVCGSGMGWDGKRSWWNDARLGYTLVWRLLVSVVEWHDSGS